MINIDRARMLLREATEEIGPVRFIDYPLLRNARAESNKRNETCESATFHDFTEDCDRCITTCIMTKA